MCPAEGSNLRPAVRQAAVPASQLCLASKAGHRRHWAGNVGNLHHAHRAVTR